MSHAADPALDEGASLEIGSWRAQGSQGRWDGSDRSGSVASSEDGRFVFGAEGAARLLQTGDDALAGYSRQRQPAPAERQRLSGLRAEAEGALAAARKAALPADSPQAPGGRLPGGSSEGALQGDGVGPRCRGIFPLTARLSCALLFAQFFPLEGVVTCWLARLTSQLALQPSCLLRFPRDLLGSHPWACRRTWSADTPTGAPALSSWRATRPQLRCDPCLPGNPESPGLRPGASMLAMALWEEAAA